jgi:two-component system cell cycle response regulator
MEGHCVFRCGNTSGALPVDAFEQGAVTVKLLIADDDRTFCELLAAEMTSNAWKVITASDAMQTIMFALRSQPDAIVLDVQMPGGTGLEALKKLKASKKTAAIPVMVVTGTDDQSTEALLLGLGAARFIRKPVDVADLRRALEDLCRESAA